MFQKTATPYYWVTIVILLIAYPMVGCVPTDPLTVSTQGEISNTEIPPSLTAAPEEMELTEMEDGESVPIPTDLSPTGMPTEAQQATIASFALTNPSFEDLDTDGNPVGWNINGDAGAFTIDENGHSGDHRLTHESDSAYQIETSQTLSGLENGWYTLRAWARSSGGQIAVYIALTCGDEERRVNIPITTPGYRWINLVVSNEVTEGECKISLVSHGIPGSWASFDDIELSQGRASLSILGADISSLKKSEDFGGVYRDVDGTEGDALDILKDHGLNYARLRIWVDPHDGYHGKAQILEMATRLKDKDIKLLVDFHYSDNWADPGKQIKPAAWEDLDFEDLKQALYDHTYDVCSSLVEQGTPPDMIQVGNEINAGMLWPDGRWDNLDNLAELLKEGYRAVKDCSPSTQVVLHIAEGGDNDLARWWFDNMTRREVPFDVIGISYYPYWHGTLMELQHNLNDITERYNKDVIVVETAYAFTSQDNDFLANIAGLGLQVEGYPYTPGGQKEMLRDIMAVVRAVPNGRGLGVFWWDATWTAVPGNGWDSADPDSGNAWENQALFDYADRVLPALDEFLDP